MDENNTQAPGLPSANQQNNEITSETHDYAASVLEAEWVECYQAEMPYLVRYLMHCCNEANIDDAADAAHEAFIELLKNWSDVKHRKAWLRTVAFRKMLRSPVKEERLSSALHRDPAAVAATSAHLELHGEEQQVLAAISRLPLTQRQVFALHYDQFSYSEIAEILGMNVDAVRKNMERAKTKMKELLGLA